MAGSSKEDKFESFMKDVKEIEKRDQVLTSDKQIDRLTKAGSKYLNLNPYEVLQIPQDTSEEDMRKKYKKLSILVHPDKNPDEKERAQKAFDALKTAKETLSDPDQVKKIKLLLEEAAALLEMNLKDKRKEAKKLSPLATIQEDDSPEAYNRLKRAITAKLFADREIKKQELQDRQQQEKKRERENELEQEESAKRQKEFEKNWDESRNNRVSDWRSFQANNKKKKEKKKAKAASTFKPFKPPSSKPEQR